MVVVPWPSGLERQNRRGIIARRFLQRKRRGSQAPLAQSVERLHGKEKVVSSILTGSSTGRLRFEGGDVAQLVRALDS